FEPVPMASLKKSLLRKHHISFTAPSFFPVGLKRMRASPGKIWDPDSPSPIPNFLFYSLVDSFPALLQSQGVYTLHAMKFFLRITSVHPDGAFLFVDFCAE
uniref:Uncharacterized protein n=1 Tax=Zosterops lateralis melanops TaxID=1220523 RepID=A0A8D2P8T4_ZOSLA